MSHDIDVPRPEGKESSLSFRSDFDRSGAPVIEGFGSPSPDKARPLDTSGERDMSAAAPGRIAPWNR